MGDGAMCHYCRKYDCECHLTAEEWRERCKTAEAECQLQRELLAALKYTVVVTVGGVDYEGFPTAEHNFLQRLRILVEKEKENAALQAEVSRLTQERDELKRIIEDQLHGVPNPEWSGTKTVEITDEE